MLTIRLTRKGKKNQPFFRIVVIDKRRSAKGGRPSEILGYIDPLTKRKSLKKERILHWLKVGAKASPTVHNLLVSEKIVDAKKINKFKKSKKPAAPVAAAPAATASAAAPAQKALEAPTTEIAPAPEVKSEVPAQETTPVPVAETIVPAPVEKSQSQSDRGSSTESGPAEVQVAPVATTAEKLIEIVKEEPKPEEKPAQ